MTLFRHELRQDWKALAIWTGSIAFFIAVCVFLYPEMESEMGNVGDIFASMGSFTAAFGMDRLNFGTLIGFYAIECGNVLGIGGALFAGLTGANMLAKEEKDRTAEFLLTHPIRRSYAVSAKLAALLAELVILNAAAYLTAIASILAIGYEVPWKELNLLHLSNFLVQVELASIGFGISAFLRRSGMGIGMGVAIGMYFINLTANLTDKVDYLKYMTPFGYAEGADVVSEGALDGTKIAIGMAVSVVCIALAYAKYTKKDIH